MAEDEVLIKMYSAPIHPADMGFCRGYYGDKSKLTPPLGCGMEGAGEIVEIGSSVEESYKGKRVAVTHDIYEPRYQGTYRQFLYAKANEVIAFPEDCDFDMISCAVGNPMTICGFIDYAQKNGHTSLINDAASSACGKILIQAAKFFNMKLINIVRKEEHVKLLAELGSEYTLNYSTDEFPEELAKAIKETEPTCYFTAIAGEIAGYVLDQMQNGSTMVIYGALSMENVSLDPRSVIFKSKTVTNYWLPVSYTIKTTFILGLDEVFISRRKREMDESCHRRYIFRRQSIWN